VSAPLENLINSNLLPLPQSNAALLALATPFIEDFCGSDVGLLGDVRPHCSRRRRCRSRRRCKGEAGGEPSRERR
jgi:hypothetical protein